MSIIVKALTTSDEEEIANCLEMLLAATANTGLMHESFNKNDVGEYTRPWFAWANSLFGELVMTMSSTCSLPVPGDPHWAQRYCSGC